MDGMVKKIYIYNSEGDYAGFARLGTDDIGEPVAEVYNEEDDRYGAIRYRELTGAELEAEVHRPDGAQIGYVRGERSEDGRFESRIYRQDVTGDLRQELATIRYTPGEEQASAYQEATGSRKAAASLKPENVSDEELVVVGAGAAMLLALD